MITTDAACSLVLSKGNDEQVQRLDPCLKKIVWDDKVLSVSRLTDSKGQPATPGLPIWPVRPWILRPLMYCRYALSVRKLYIIRYSKYTETMFS